MPSRAFVANQRIIAVPHLVAAHAADFATITATITIRNTSTTVLSRPAHYPQAGFILDYADRAGIQLIPEVPAWQLTATQMADPHMRKLVQNLLEEMITTQWNHPAVWAWSFGNSVP
ncbi:MAG TPA: glycoside hydrolase family 2 TIM barrel-domain containing protein [Candidatus Tectomicrobia bacterium]|nr:glycoside hydrolase family 2 TIM barrel-domain containing protein [Candidatus Tectomicrobia bacterium]